MHSLFLVLACAFFFFPFPTFGGNNSEHSLSDRPPISQAEVLSWVPDAVQEIMTFGFHDHELRFKASKRHFTGFGWGKFQQALRAAAILESLKENRQVIALSVDEAPKILVEEIKNDKTQWTVRIPVSVKYMQSDKTRKVEWDLTLIIVQSEEPQNQYGFAIEQWVARMRV